MVQSRLPPEGAHGIIDTFEPRPGGAFRMTLMFETAGAPGTGKSTPTTNVVEGTILEAVPERLVRQQLQFRSDDPAFGGVMTMTWAITLALDRPEVTVTAKRVPVDIGQQDHETAMASSLANLVKSAE